MIKRTIAERYSSALLDMAKKTGEMEKVFDELLFIKRLLIENTGMKRFFESPNIAQADKVAFVKKVLSPHLSRTSINFLLLLLRKYRLRYLMEIIEEYQRLHDIEKAIQRVDVITVNPLDDILMEKLHRTVERAMKKSVILCVYVDPRILGGVIVKTPNLIINGSARKKLSDLSYALTSFKV